MTAFSLPTPVGGETGTPSAGLNAWGGNVAVSNGKDNGTLPKAFVNLIILDKNYKFLDYAWDGISGGAQPLGDENKTPHDLMAKEYVAREEGYIYVYVSNENPTLVEVYFDDVTITYTPSNLIQYNEYYPFGMNTANSWTRENTLGNKFLANGGTELNGVSLFYDLDFRNYDVQIGRFIQVDPMATKYASLSSYNFAMCNPSSYVDPTGADVTWESLMVTINQLLNSGGGEWTRDKYDEDIMDPVGGGSMPGISGYFGSTFEMFKMSGRTFVTVSVYSADVSSSEKEKGIMLTGATNIFKVQTLAEDKKDDKVDRSQLRSGHVSVGFDSGADNEINPKVAGYFAILMIEASKSGITSVNISSTTNHPSNSENSAHTAKNGAKAFDINRVNGVPVSINNTYASTLQKVVQSTPGWRENYGPLIIQKMMNGIATEAPWAREGKGGHYDHIHVSVK